MLIVEEITFSSGDEKLLDISGEVSNTEGRPTWQPFVCGPEFALQSRLQY
jgi:hypothetical protein